MKIQLNFSVLCLSVFWFEIEYGPICAYEMQMLVIELQLGSFLVR